MRAAFFKSVLTAASLGFATSGGMLPAGAADLGLMTSGPGAVGNCSEIVFTCDNGRQYPLCPIAVSVVGEVVTASLHTGHRGGTHVRLVPMGVGYRYAGRGDMAGWLSRKRPAQLRKAQPDRLHDPALLTDSALYPFDRNTTRDERGYINALGWTYRGQ